MTLNDSETSPPTLTFAINPVCRASIIVVNFFGHAYFLSICHIPPLPTVSNALLKYSGGSCLMPFYCSCRRQNLIFTVLRLPLKPHCVSGTTSGVMCYACLLWKEEKFLYSSHCLFDHLSCRWLQCWHPSVLVIHNPPPTHW